MKIKDYGKMYNIARKFEIMMREKLPQGYLLNDGDITWLRVVAFYWNEGEGNVSILDAFKKASLEFGYSVHIDPYELAVDANICDKKIKLK